MSALPPPSRDAARRAPAWDAWSTLYLDTELSPAMQDAVARDLAATAYTLDELRAILWAEVHPACCPNLLSPAGEWQAFDADWLRQRILARSNAALRWPAALLPGRKMIADTAERILARVAALRGEQ